MTSLYESVACDCKYQKETPQEAVVEDSEILEKIPLDISTDDDLEYPPYIYMTSESSGDAAASPEKTVSKPDN